MGDQRDPAQDAGLEAEIREVLRSEAASLPFTLRPDTVRRVRAERRRAKRTQMISMLAAVAVVVLAVAGVAGLASLRSPNPIASSPSPATGATIAPSGTPGASLSAEPSPSAAPSASAGWQAPSAADLLAAAGHGAVRLATLEGVSAAQDSVLRFAPAPHRGALAVAVACSGAEGIGVAFSDAALPSSDPGGSDSPFGGQIPCDGTPQIVPWNGWNSVFLAHGPQVGLAVKAGTAYRALLVDTSAVAADGEQTAVADGLPTITHLSDARSDVGLVIATGERLSPAGDTGSEVQAADIRPSSGIHLLVTCAGGTATVAAATPQQAVGNGFSDQYAEIGAPVCDGTVQAFDWARTDGPSNADRVVVNATAGTSWRIVVWDMTGGSHPNPTVPCGSSAGLKAAPRPTLYQGGQALGTLPSYYTSSWGSTHDDGVPSVPATALEAKAGQPLQLRMPRDICAGSWSVVYGTPAASGTGIDPVGALALLNEYPTTIAASENRIDLASLPPGDWVVSITLGFDNGAGAGLLRVRVTG